MTRLCGIRFNTYRFADHKEELITLLKRVTTVCVESVHLRRELEQMEWGSATKVEIYHQDSQIQEGGRQAYQPAIKTRPNAGKD